MTMTGLTEINDTATKNEIVQSHRANMKYPFCFSKLKLLLLMEEVWRIYYIEVAVSFEVGFGGLFGVFSWMGVCTSRGGCEMPRPCVRDFEQAQVIPQDSKSSLTL
jgi:hypothetical protein